MDGAWVRVVLGLMMMMMKFDRSVWLDDDVIVKRHTDDGHTDTLSDG